MADSEANTRSTFMIIGIIALAVLVYSVFHGFYVAMTFLDPVRDTLNEDPVIVEHIGEIQEIEFAQGEVAEGEFGFEIRGPKGRGVVSTKSWTEDENGTHLESPVLRLPDGREFELDVGGDPGSDAGGALEP